MNTLKILLFALLVAATSCNKDEPGIAFEIIGDQVLQAKPGESTEVRFRFLDDDGISQIALESKDLNLDYLENINSSPEVVTRDITFTIPGNYEAGQFYFITLEISDGAGNKLIETINVDVI